LEQRARGAEASHEGARNQLAELEGRHEALRSEHQAVQDGLASLQARHIVHPFCEMCALVQDVRVWNRKAPQSKLL